MLTNKHSACAGDRPAQAAVQAGYAQHATGVYALDSNALQSVCNSAQVCMITCLLLADLQTAAMQTGLQSC